MSFGRIMPAFTDPLGNPRPESVVVGRLLSGYGDLELCMCYCMIKMPGWDFDKALKSVFGKRGEKQRIDRAHADLGPAYKAVGRPI